MLIKPDQKKSLYWVVTSIISACVGVACHIGAWEIKVEVWDYGKEYDIGLHNIFSSARDVFIIIAAPVLGVIGIIKIIQNWKVRKLSGILEFVALLFVGLFLFGFTLTTNELYRIRRAVSHNMLIRIKEVGKAINQYSNKYNYMPEANWWCYLLIDEPNVGIDEHDFRIGQFPNIKCNFAFNKNLDKLSLDETKGDVVLLFEADGELDFSGGPELINEERTKDKYFIFKKQKFIYILFVDGTIVKYRIHDGAVAKYDEKVDEFTAFVRKGKTPYSPLRWKP